jgi:hypothetical protein
MNLEIERYEGELRTLRQVAAGANMIKLTACSLVERSTNPEFLYVRPEHICAMARKSVKENYKLDTTEKTWTCLHLASGEKVWVSETPEEILSATTCTSSI